MVSWLDPFTVRLVYTLVNTGTTVAHQLRTLNGPWPFCRRARCLVGGAIIDDVDYYNRVHDMLHVLTSKNNRDNDSIEGFEQRWDDDTNYESWRTELNGLGGGAPNNAKTVSFKPLFGILNQPKYVPLSWCPIMMEFEVVNNATDPIASPNNGAGSRFTTDNTSTSWQIQDVRIVCDVVTLDSALQNSYAEMVLSGKSLPINYSTYISQFQTITSSDFAINVSRSVTRLKTVFVTFDGDHNVDSTQSSQVHKNFNTFKHPMASLDYLPLEGYEYNKELQWQLQIGSKMFPEYPVRSLAETFYQLKKALGIQGSAFHSLSFTPVQYRTDHFIIGVDTEKILEAGFTGLNTRSGDLMIVRGKYANSNDSTVWANSIYMVLHTDQILEIRDTGCQVFD